MKKFLLSALDLLFPPRCVFCRKLLGAKERQICARCVSDLPFTGAGHAETTGEFFARCVSPLWYQGMVRESFLRYKFQGRTGYAKIYARLLAQGIRDYLEEPFDLITWVPLSPQGLKRRGYDQSMLLAMATALELGEVAVEMLKKVRVTQTQSDLREDSARRANVLGAYQVTDAELVAGQRVLLIDDIVTTAATLSECARVLRTAGAERVVCATLAKARRD